MEIVKLLLFLIILTRTDLAWSAQCPRDHSVESAFNKSERGFLAYVTDIKLEEKLLKKLGKEYPVMNKSGEHVKLISAGYHIIEEFKGNTEYRPRLLDMLGIGTGYVGLTPGVYYLVFLPHISADEDPGLRHVNMCTVPISHYRLNEDDFQSELNRVRKLRVH